MRKWRFPIQEQIRFSFLFGVDKIGEEVVIIYGIKIGQIQIEIERKCVQKKRNKKL